MILQELLALYERLYEEQAQGGAVEVAPYGFSIEKVSFSLVIAPDGTLIDVEDERNHDGKKARATPMAVPEHPKRTSGIAPCFLCDTSSYLLGCDTKGKPQRAQQTFNDARVLHAAFATAHPDEEGLSAVAAFFASWDPAECEGLRFSDELLAGGNIVFRLKDSRQFVHESPGVRHAWSEHIAATAEGAHEGVCLVTGERLPIARLHPSIKGVRGGQSSGGSIVSFNKKSFESYGKKHGANAPVSEHVAFRYVSALNALITNDERHVQIADATTVFWAERHTPFESIFQVAMAGGRDVEADKEVLVALTRLRDGRPVTEIDPDIRFFVLGLAPNVSRISIRFWLTDTVGHFASHIAAHLRDLAIEKQYERNMETIPAWLLVRESATRYAGSGKDRKPIVGDANPRLAGSLTRAILTGADYPRMLLAAFVTRMHSDGEVNYVRVAAIKAVITRRRRKTQQQEVPVALQKDFESQGYQLGRLFAALERAQKAALGDVNATIKDRYFGAASSTPGRVFPILMRLSQHHIAKAEWGRSVDRTIAEVMDGITTFPTHLALEEQGLFAIGYYHQRNDFFRKKETKEENT